MKQKQRLMRLIVFTSIFEQKRRSQLSFEENSLSEMNWGKIATIGSAILETAMTMLGKETPLNTS